MEKKLREPLERLEAEREMEREALCEFYSVIKVRETVLCFVVFFSGKINKGLLLWFIESGRYSVEEIIFFFNSTWSFPSGRCPCQVGPLLSIFLVL